MNPDTNHWNWIEPRIYYALLQLAQGQKKCRREMLNTILHRVLFGDAPIPESEKCKWNIPDSEVWGG